MDGGNPVVLVRDVISPLYVTIDLQVKKLYWSTASHGEVSLAMSPPSHSLILPHDGKDA